MAFWPRLTMKHVSKKIGLPPMDNPAATVKNSFLKGRNTEPGQNLKMNHALLHRKRLLGDILNLFGITACKDLKQFPGCSGITHRLWALSRFFLSSRNNKNRHLNNNKIVCFCIKIYIFYEAPTGGRCLKENIGA